MVEAIRDPILLTQVGRAVDDELTRRFVVGRSCLHLHRVIAVAELSEAEAANSLKVIDAVE